MLTTSKNRTLLQQFQRQKVPLLDAEHYNTQWRLALRKVLAAASVSLSAGSPKSSSLLAGLSRKREPGELCDETCRQAKQMTFSFSL